MTDKFIPCAECEGRGAKMHLMPTTIAFSIALAYRSRMPVPLPVRCPKCRGTGKTIVFNDRSKK